jgi:general secretion pathway protein F
MPVYQYRGIDAREKKVSGIVDAESAHAARQKLRRLEIFPTELAETLEKQKEARRFRFLEMGGRVKAMELSVMTRQLSTLVGAGLPLVRCLTALTEQVQNPRLRNVLAEVREAVNEGSSLADALAKYPGIFSDLYVNMIRSGEHSGALEIILKRLSDFTESQSDLRNKVLYALMYPVMILIIGFLVVMLMFVFVIPKITVLFEQTHQALPILTQVVISFSAFVRSWWWLIVILIVGAWAGIRFYLRTPAGREGYDEIILRVPVIGGLVQKLAISRFAKTLSTLLMSGIPLLRSMEIVEKVVNNIVISQAISRARENITEGASIAEPLKVSGMFPPFVIQMIASGEQSGELEFMLEKTADSFDREVDAAINGLTALIEPFMILGLALIVALIILSFLMPILQITEKLG